jgi:hypothetical protein
MKGEEEGEVEEEEEEEGEEEEEEEHEEREKGTGDEVAEIFEDQEGEEGEEDEEKESELETHREKRQHIAAASSQQAPSNLIYTPKTAVALRAPCLRLGPKGRRAALRERISTRAVFLICHHGPLHLAIPHCCCH